MEGAIIVLCDRYVLLNLKEKLWIVVNWSYFMDRNVGQIQNSMYKKVDIATIKLLKQLCEITRTDKNNTIAIQE